jgi:hypothetical protein
VPTSPDCGLAVDLGSNVQQEERGDGDTEQGPDEVQQHHFSLLVALKQPVEAEEGEEVEEGKAPKPEEFHPG